MRTGIDHLPPAKQRELERVVDIVFEEFREAIEHATGSRKRARILKIILFGSYSRGDWVDAPLSANQYKSDYDILIIVSQKELTDRAAFWAKCEEWLIRAYTIEKTLRTPVNFIVHSLQEVNDGLAHGRVFFMEIAKDGIALYEADDRKLHEPKPKTPKEALAMAKEYFEEWFPSARYARKLADYSLKDGQRRFAAFNLHQATERLYACLLLTTTFYSPYNHNIAFLRSQAERLDRRLIDIWPMATRRERAMFQKLKDAYTKARYSKLCRARHNFDYAERQTMPRRHRRAWLSAGLDVIGSA